MLMFQKVKLWHKVTLLLRMWIELLLVRKIVI
jgi:hypothetical protein